MKRITFAASLIVSAFLFAGVVDKLLHWTPFVVILARNPLVPTDIVGAVAGGVIALEGLVGALLLLPATRRHGLVLGAVMFLFFSGVIALLLWVAPASSCGCSFTMGSGTVSVQHLVLNVLLTFLCTHCFFTGFRTTPANRGMRPPFASTATPSTTTNQRSAP